MWWWWWVLGVFLVAVCMCEGRGRWWLADGGHVDVLLHAACTRSGAGLTGVAETSSVSVSYGSCRGGRRGWVAWLNVAVGLAMHFASSLFSLLWPLCSVLMSCMSEDSSWVRMAWWFANSLRCAGTTWHRVQASGGRWVGVHATYTATTTGTAQPVGTTCHAHVLALPAPSLRRH